MVSNKRSSCLNPDRIAYSLGLVFLAAILASACSAEISRFNLDDGPTTGAIPATPSEPVYGKRSALGGAGSDSAFAMSREGGQTPPTGVYRPQNNSYNSYKGTNVSTAPLGEAAAPDYSRPASTRTARSTVVPPIAEQSQSRSLADDAAASTYARRGDIIEVQRGDTLYGLARRHRVSVNDLMSVNGLSTSALKPGQKLYLPANSVDAPRAVAERPQTAIADAPAHWTGTYTIAPGDSLYSLARRYNVKTAELQRYNGISNPRMMRPGLVLKVPGPGGHDGTLAARDAGPAAPRYGGVQADTIAGSPGSTTLLNGSDPNTRVAALGDGNGGGSANGVASDAAPASGQSVTVRGDELRDSNISGSDKLRWPARGRIVSAFGKRNDGTHNDGVNLAVPLGTNIHAAEAGMVAYAGDELKGYGNLVLVRHDNGWVTAYAHADKVLVKRGDRVRRGDVIAKAGRTGEVDQPQLHFELRQGQKPVDPIPFLERL